MIENTVVKNKISYVEQTREHIRKNLLLAKETGLQEIDLLSRNIHKEMGFDNRYPTVCDAMRSIGIYRMEILQSPPKGKGARLKIRYYLH